MKLSGLGNPTVIRGQLELIKLEDPKLVFLSEMKLVGARVGVLWNQIGFYGGVVVDCVGRSGGLALWWKKSLDVYLQSYSKGYIDLLVREGLGGITAYIIGFYGYPELKNNGSSWQLLQHLSHGRKLPWVCGGDFNEIMFAWEERHER